MVGAGAGVAAGEEAAALEVVELEELLLDEEPEAGVLLAVVDDVPPVLEDPGVAVAALAAPSSSRSMLFYKAVISPWTAVISDCRVVRVP